MPVATSSSLKLSYIAKCPKRLPCQARTPIKLRVSLDKEPLHTPFPSFSPASQLRIDTRKGYNIAYYSIIFYGIALRFGRVGGEDAEIIFSRNDFTDYHLPMLARF